MRINTINYIKWFANCELWILNSNSDIWRAMKRRQCYIEMQMRRVFEVLECRKKHFQTFNNKNKVIRSVYQLDHDQFSKCWKKKKLRHHYSNTEGDLMFLNKLIRNHTKSILKNLLIYHSHHYMPTQRNHSIYNDCYLARTDSYKRFRLFHIFCPRRRDKY